MSDGRPPVKTATEARQGRQTLSLGCNMRARANFKRNILLMN